MEGTKDHVVSEREHVWLEEGAIVIHILHDQTVCEWLHAHLLEKSSLGRIHLHTLVKNVHIVDDLNLTLGNLGTDVQGLEERSLRRLERGDALFDDNINL